MGIWNGWPSKPIQGCPINPTHPWAQGLVAFYAGNEGSGGLINDYRGQLTMSATGFGSTNPWGGGPGGVGLLCNVAGLGAQATLPTTLNFSYPLAFACGVSFLGFPDTNAGIFGITTNNTDTTPFAAMNLSCGGSTVQLNYTTGGSFFAANSSSFGFAGDAVLAGRCTTGSQTIYINGVSAGSNSNALASPSYTATSLMFAGNHSGISHNSNMIFYWGAFWNRLLLNAELFNIGANVNAIWQMFQAPFPWWLKPGAAAPAGASSYFPGSSILRPVQRPAIAAGPFASMYD
jgi:hypothetical protein